MLAVLKREFKSYFLSPVGYVVMGIFLLVFSVFFYLTVFQYGSIDLGGLYYNTAVFGLIIIVPILTMRMFSEERKNGTEQLLLTSPTSMWKIVLGKLFAALGVILITLVISLMYLIIISFFGKANIASTLVAILGFILISIAAISFGMFASAITENQIIAGIITIAFLLLPLFLIDISTVFSSFLLSNYYRLFAQGVISIEDTISLATFGLAFILLTMIIMQRRKVK